MLGRNDPCWCGSGSKWKKCHYPDICKPLEKNLKQEYFDKHRIFLKDKSQIIGIRAACQCASSILDALCKEAKQGITTNELNALAEKLHRSYGATAAPLNYGSPPFPKSICTSLNDVICHGIPDNTPLKEGDILNIDVTVILNGYYGDCSRMVSIGEISEEKQLVVDVSYACLMQAIQILKPGIKLNKIGDVIETYAAHHHCSVVHQFVGHGVGLHFHENPQVCHHRNQNELILVPGMTFTIEPMINAGSPDAIIDPLDQWTARTKDHRPSAQYEHTVLITEEGHEILTWLESSTR